MEFTDMELSIIGNMMVSKPNRQIAELLDIDVAHINTEVNRQAALLGIIPLQSKIDAKIAQKKAIRAKHQTKRGNEAINRKARQETEIQKADRIRKEQRQQEKLTRLNADEKSRVFREKARGPKFQTKQVDYTQLHAVRIDKKTIIYIKPGQDEDKAREHFLKTHTK